MSLGNPFSGWLPLGGDFPPTLNNKKNPANLKLDESPAAYGIDPAREGELKTLSTCPTGTARTASTSTVGGNSYTSYYDRLWRASSSQLIYGAPYYDKVFHKQGIGKVVADATIVTFMPCFQTDMWIVTASGSQFINNAKSHANQFTLSEFLQELYTSTASYANTLDGLPVVCNAAGVFLHDSNKVVELTYPVRDSLGSFASVAILMNYPKKWIIGTNKFVIDLPNKKLFDFGTAGFLYTTRTLQQEQGYNPFQCQEIGINAEFGSGETATIAWETKFEDNDWVAEPDIVWTYDAGQKSRITAQITNVPCTARKFAMRITSLSSHLYIRNIDVLVKGYAQRAPSE